MLNVILVFIESKENGNALTEVGDANVLGDFMSGLKLFKYKNSYAII
jgi:hypothetical protein